MHKRITDNLEVLLETLPPHLLEPLQQRPDQGELLEIVMDLGRPPEARYVKEEIILSPDEIKEGDIEYVVARIGVFGGDNRAGIERTLHRISAIRNRSGRIVGLTCRVGRAVFGTIKIIEDLIQSGKSILLMGRPGVGKTTMLREVARVLADDLNKRVIIVDTSNEIAGDGDIPHPAIGHARRMQVPTPAQQHAVMIEGVENHMPEVIIIDEIGTELEAAAARTIAERGVQLVATAHGNTLENLIMNPTLSDLIGGIQSVTLGDEEARRRGTQKSILERKAPPTFEILVEIQDWERVAIRSNVAKVVDAMLRGRTTPPEIRWLDEEGNVQKEMPATAPAERAPAPVSSRREGPSPRLYLFGVNRSRVEQALKNLKLSLSLANDVKEANLVLTTKAFYRRKPQTLRTAEAEGIPIFVIRKNNIPQIEDSLMTIYGVEKPQDFPLSRALEEAQKAAERVMEGEELVELIPQSSFIRRLQHEIANRHNLPSSSIGREPLRRVRIFRGNIAVED